MVNLFKKKGGVFRFGTQLDYWGEQLPPLLLQGQGYSTAIINVDGSVFSKDLVSRRMILDISGESSLHLWTANKYREFVGQGVLETGDIKGAYYLNEADATFALFRYYTSPLESKGKIRKIAFHRAVVGNFPKGFFKDKIVLVGANYLSQKGDYVLTPFDNENARTSKLTMHAQIIQSLIQNKTIYPISKQVTYFLSLILTLLLSIIISRLNPAKGLLITSFVIVGIFLISWFLFSFFGLWVYMTHLILTVAVGYYILVPVRAIVEYQRRFAIQEEATLIKKVENLKQNFISLMSHDLKTPVAKIAGVADVLLQQSKGNEIISKGLRGIIDATKELNRFITSILDLTKIESRNLKLNIISKDVNTIIETVISDLKYEVSNEDVVIESQLSPLYPIKIDVDLTKRVISNLVENAIKYSGKNANVNIKTYDDEKWVYIEVSDNGVGIAVEDLKHIFDKFYRVKNDASHTIKGTGLGLFLVKYFVELQDGRIDVHSTVNEGTTFKVKLKNV